MALAQIDSRSGSRSETSTVASGHTLTREDLERDLLSLYEQLLATRLELIDGARPRDGSLNLSPGELDCVLGQLDSAIVAARSMVSSAVRTPCDSESHLGSHWSAPPTLDNGLRTLTPTPVVCKGYGATQ